MPRCQLGADKLSLTGLESGEAFGSEVFSGRCSGSRSGEN